jgi:cell division protein FtsN
MFAGIFIGFILGIGTALGVAWYINKMPSPFLSHDQAAQKPAALPAPQAATAPDVKPKFDFYSILPGKESSPAKVAPPAATPSAPATPISESYYLQAGAFQKKDEADNMKAKLAMIGLESEIQAGPGASKYRVRIGPYQNEQDMKKAQDELQQNGIASSVVKIKESGQ